MDTFKLRFMFSSARYLEPETTEHRALEAARRVKCKRDVGSNHNVQTKPCSVWCFIFSFPFYFLTIPQLFLALAKHQINFEEMLGSHKSINGETPGNVSPPPQVGFQMIQAVSPNLSHHITVQITANKLRKKKQN